MSWSGHECLSELHAVYSFFVILYDLDVDFFWLSSFLCSFVELEGQYHIDMGHAFGGMVAPCRSGCHLAVR